MWTTKRICVLLLAGTLSASCTENTPDEPVAPYRAQLRIFNDRIFNDRIFNDRIFNDKIFNDKIFNDKIFNDKTFNDKIFNDKIFNDKTFNGISLNGVKVENVTFEGSLLKGTVGKQQISGTQFTGVMIEVNFADPKATNYKFRIDEVTLDAEAAAKGFKDVWRYRVSMWTSISNTWVSLCNDSAGRPADLIPLLGMYWDQATGNRIDDPNSLTLACKDGALEKCTHVGYRPWATGTICKSQRSKNCTQISLKDHHQACTRMLRADYCGDGVSFTENGTLLDIFDYLSPPVALREESWDIEARWLTTGALCLSKPRHPELGFTGKCKDSRGKERTLRSCSPYEEDKGLVVSSFNSGSSNGKDKDKDKDK